MNPFCSPFQYYIKTTPNKITLVQLMSNSKLWAEKQVKSRTKPQETNFGLERSKAKKTYSPTCHDWVIPRFLSKLLYCALYICYMKSFAMQNKDTPWCKTSGTCHNMWGVFQWNPRLCIYWEFAPSERVWKRQSRKFLRLVFHLAMRANTNHT